MIKTMFIKSAKKGSQQTFFCQKTHLGSMKVEFWGKNFSYIVIHVATFESAAKKHTLFTDRKKIDLHAKKVTQNRCF